MSTWYVVQVEDSCDSTVLGLGVRLLFAVSPNDQIAREVRGIDSIAKSASIKGFDLSYCTSFCGITGQRLDQVRKAVRNKLFKEYGSFPLHAVQVEPVLRLTKHG